MKFEHKLYHRITHKNGRVGDWVMDGIMSNSEILLSSMLTSTRRMLNASARQ